MDPITSFIDGLPKAELHIHTEGSLEPELMFALADRNGITLPYASVEALRAAYDFSSLQDFLEIYYRGAGVRHEVRNFYDPPWAYLISARADNVLHTEISFDSQTHTDRGVAFETVIDGIHAALVDGEAKLGITSKLILCFLRHLDEDAAQATLDMALDHKHRITAVGLDSSECGHPPSKFARVFERARGEGFLAVAHAGEEGPPDYVREALDDLQVSRIDHGNRALEDHGLVERLAAMRMPLTVCPLSNLRLGVVPDMAAHPLPEMIAKRLMVTVNSDDPPYFGGYFNAHSHALRVALHLTRDDFAGLARNSFEAAFLDHAHKRALIARLDAYLDES